MNNELEEIVFKISDVLEVAIMALEKLNSCESVQIATVLKMNRKNIDELQNKISEGKNEQEC